MSEKQYLDDIPQRAHSRTREHMNVQKSGGSSALRKALADLPLEEKRRILGAPADCREKLARMGVEGIVIDRLCILSRMENYNKLTVCPERLMQAELETFLDGAFRESGLQRAVVLELVSDIADTLETACRIEPANALETLEREILREEAEPDRGAPAFIVPFSFYVMELDEIRAQFEAWRLHGREAIPKDTLKRLQALCALGVPEAQYYLGAYLLKKPDGDITRTRNDALEWLKRAARAGNADAAAALGDYYYHKGATREVNLGEKSEYWGNALAYYTGYGASALNKGRRQHALEIFNQREKSQRVLRGGVIWFAFTLLWAFVAAFLMPTILAKIAGIIYAVCNGGVCLHFHASLKKRPYGVASSLLTLMLITMSAYLVVLILLFFLFPYQGGRFG